MSFTLRSAEEFFGMAARYQLPFKFDQEGAGFQDTVILLTIVDHLRANPSRVGALLTNDGVFDEATVRRLAAAAGATLKVYRTIDAAYNAVVDRIRQDFRQVWEGRREAATGGLNNQLPMIKDYIIRNLDVSGVRVGLFEEPVSVALQDLHPVEPQAVFPPWPEPGEPAGPHKIEFSVQATFTAVVERTAEPPTTSPLRIGEERLTGMARFLPLLAGLPQPPQRVTVPVPGTIDAEAWADFADGGYTNVQMVAATLR